MLYSYKSINMFTFRYFDIIVINNKKKKWLQFAAYNIFSIISFGIETKLQVNSIVKRNISTNKIDHIN